MSNLHQMQSNQNKGIDSTLNAKWWEADDFNNFYWL